MMGTWVSVGVPRFTLTPSAWNIVVDGVYRGTVVKTSWGSGPRQFFATHNGRAVYAATRDEAARQMLAASEADR